MKKKLSPKQLEFYNFIDKVLLIDWNPIGVDGLPEDEYESYVPSIFYLAIYNYNEDTIAKKLLTIETDQIGLPGNMQHCSNIAEKIINKKTELGL